MRVATLLVLLPFATFVAAQDVVRPRHNNSFVPADDRTTQALVLQARTAAADGDAERAADRLQALLLGAGSGVVAVRGHEVFVGPRRWAQIQLLAEDAPFGAEVLAAWRRLHDAEAGAALRSAIAAGDEDEILAQLERNPAATAAPYALLALADRALQRGHRDEALGHLLRLPEHVARSEEAAWLDAPAYRLRLEHVQSIPAERPAGWPTLGGDATRARPGDPVPAPDDLVRLWKTPVRVSDPLEFEVPDRDYSTIVPLYPVCDAANVYVHLGTAVAVLDRVSGRLLHWLPKGAEPPDEEATYELLYKTPGVRAATVHEGVVYFHRVPQRDFDPQRQALDWPRRNTLYAVDTLTLETVWAIRGERALRKRVFFRGAPAVDRERLYVYGAVREVVGEDEQRGERGEPTRKEEAYLLCYDRHTARLLWQRFLGYGETPGAASLPPQGGLAPAVSAGVVVVVTGLGVAAALDARTGEVLWMLRYDRQEGRERQRLLDMSDRDERVPLESAWKREPPRIAGDTVFLAAFDGMNLETCWLRGQRREPDVGFSVVKESTPRQRSYPNCLFEYVAGVAGSRVFVVGRMDPHHPDTYRAVYSEDHSGGGTWPWAYGILPADRRSEHGALAVPPELFGRPTLAGDVLLVPTRDRVFRYGTTPRRREGDGERDHELPLLAPYVAPADEPEPGFEVAPQFGTLVAVDGFLYATTGDHVICYGVK